MVSPLASARRHQARARVHARCAPDRAMPVSSPAVQLLHAAVMVQRQRQRVQVTSALTRAKQRGQAAQAAGSV